MNTHMHIISSSFPSSYSPVLLQLHLISQPYLSQAISPCLLFINSLLFSTPSLASLLSPPFFHLSLLCSFFFCLFLTVFFLWVDEELGVGGCTGVFLCGRLQIWKGHPLSLIQVNPGLLVLRDATQHVWQLYRDSQKEETSLICIYACVCLCVRVCLLKLMSVCEKEECVWAKHLSAVPCRWKELISPWQQSWLSINLWWEAAMLISRR